MKEKEYKFKIPYLFYLNFKIMVLNQYIFHIRLPLFSLNICFLGSGGTCSFGHFSKWCYIHHIHIKDIIFIFNLGLDYSAYLDWKIKRMIKKMTTKQIQEWNKTVDRILGDKR